MSEQQYQITDQPELTVTAGQTHVDGRKIRTVGTISAAGVECVTVNGLFIAKHPPRPR